MNEELKAAEERWRNSDGFAICDESECFEDVYLLAGAHMDDLARREEREDAEPVVEAYLESICQGRTDMDGYIVPIIDGESVLEIESGYGHWLVYAVDVTDAHVVRIADVSTRGQLLDLLRALNIETKETT